jgi:hypothetical protein
MPRHVNRRMPNHFNFLASYFAHRADHFRHPPLCLFLGYHLVLSHITTLPTRRSTLTVIPKRFENLFARMKQVPSEPVDTKRFPDPSATNRYNGRLRNIFYSPRFLLG